jgi:hypothetical protein
MLRRAIFWVDLGTKGAQMKRKGVYESSEIWACSRSKAYSKSEAGKDKNNTTLLKFSTIYYSSSVAK